MTHPLQVELDRRPEAAPLYVQIRERLALLIRRGDLSAGTRLPPERQLADELHINRTTVVRAYSDLAAAGLVHAHVGRGTIVQGSNDAGPLLDRTEPSRISNAGSLTAFPWAAYLGEASV